MLQGTEFQNFSLYRCLWKWVEFQFVFEELPIGGQDRLILYTRTNLSPNWPLCTHAHVVPEGLGCPHTLVLTPGLSGKLSLQFLLVAQPFARLKQAASWKMMGDFPSPQTSLSQNVTQYELLCGLNLVSLLQLKSISIYLFSVEIDTNQLCHTLTFQRLKSVPTVFSPPG